MEKLNSVKKILLTCTLLWVYGLSFSQNTTPFSLDLVNGLSFPVSDFENFSEAGFNTGFIMNKTFCDAFSVGLNTNYTSLPLNDAFGVSNESWNALSLLVGPAYNIQLKKSFITVYGRLGLSSIDIPEIISFYPQTKLETTNIQKSSINGLNTRLGIRLGTEVCNGLRFFISSEYSKITNDVNYQTRDLSSAVGPTGQIDPDLAGDIPFENSSFSFASFNVNFGIQLDLSTCSKKGTRAQDYNSSRSNNSSSRATDYNSSRSNKSEKSVNGDSSGARDYNSSRSNNSSSRATDHNSSRSNKTSSYTIDDNGGEGNGNRATDYNSSRSNKSEKSVNGDSNGARDYNSSRSNNGSSIAEDPNNDGDVNRATDHNSSRSNKTSSYTVDDNGGDGNKATDYNSSRSNKHTNN